MHLFTCTLFFNNYPVRYEVRSQDGTGMLLFIPVDMNDNCEMPSIFYAARKGEEWTVLNIHDQQLISQVAEQIKTLYEAPIQHSMI